jgi:hypothetical protein
MEARSVGQHLDVGVWEIEGQLWGDGLREGFREVSVWVGAGLRVCLGAGAGVVDLD